MTPTDFMRALASLREDWRAELPRILEENLFYVDVATFGRDTFRALVEGREPEWGTAFFAEVERALVEGDASACELVVVGLFESMQNESYAEGPDDLIESRLGPVSRAAWGDLIEGWTGHGVRTVAAWRARGRQ